MRKETIGKIEISPQELDTAIEALTVARNLQYGYLEGSTSGSEPKDDEAADDAAELCSAYVRFHEALKNLTLRRGSL
jgi:hypothetical protein